MLHTTSVVIPARDEAATVGTIVRACVALADVLEVVVVDDGSTDGTSRIAEAAGARVVRASGGPGKGAAMRDGVAAAEGDIVVFCDADLQPFDPTIVTRLSSTLAAAGGRIALVKGDCERAGEGGRVTELTAKPALRLLHPHLAHVTQPLAGEYAAWREVLQRVPFVRGYGVDIGLLLDIASRYGAGAIADVHLGTRHHRARTLRELSAQADEVLAVALERAGVPGVSVPTCPPLLPAPPRRRSA